MLTRLDFRQAVDAVIPRPKMADEPPVEIVRVIIDQVRRGGDGALRDLTRQFDQVNVDEIRVPDVEIETALRDTPPLLREALEEAAEAIAAFHRSTKPEDGRYERDGVVVRDIWRPVESAGCYVPGGRALYPSSVMMSAIPARVAGVERVALCVPPRADGNIAQVVLAAARLAEVDDVYRVGGAQAIAAMAYGTESVLPVDLIVGAGNIYVSTAKREVAGIVGVPSSFAGPSEVVVIADETTPPEYAAIDLMVQAEHGPDGIAWLITWSEETATAVDEAIGALLGKAERREEIESSLSQNGFVALVEDAAAAIELANRIAPEHLQIMTVDPEALVPMVRHAGAVFAGTNAPASVGDYIAGPSHVLPVYGSARFADALGVRDFLRNQHVISLDEAATSRLAPHIAAIAEAEGFEAHARSVRMRLRP